MKKLLLLLSIAVLFGGFSYMGDTLALGPTRAAEESGIRQTVRARKAGGNKLDVMEAEPTLLPSVYGNDFSFDTSKQTVTVKYEQEAYSALLWKDISGAQDQFVVVYNANASVPCYFRTYVAFEDNGVFEKYIVANWNEADYLVEKIGAMKIGGVPCMVYCATYKDELAGGKLSEPSLMQIAMRREADNAAVANLGEKYTIFTATEAIWQEVEAESIDSPDDLDTFLSNTIPAEEAARIVALLTPPSAP